MDSYGWWEKGKGWEVQRVCLVTLKWFQDWRDKRKGGDRGEPAWANNQDVCSSRHNGIT